LFEEWNVWVFARLIVFFSQNFPRIFSDLFLPIRDFIHTKKIFFIGRRRKKQEMFITTRRKPTMTPIEFRDFLLHYPKIDVDAKFKEYENFAKEGFAEDGKFSMKWLARTLKKIDEIYYKNQLLPFINLLYGRLLIKPVVDEVQTAGFVVENSEGDLELCLNQQLFIDLFEGNSQKSYHAGGLLCSDRLSCINQVLLHEVAHIALSLCDKLGLYDDSTNHHGKIFMQLVKRMLNHCDSLHGLVPSLFHDDSLCSLKSKLREFDNVLVFFKFRFVPGIVKRIFRKKVEVEIDGETYTVHMGLIKYPK
jgi:hypothetical protein